MRTLTVPMGAMLAVVTYMGGCASLAGGSSLETDPSTCLGYLKERHANRLIAGAIEADRWPHDLGLLQGLWPR